MQILIIHNTYVESCMTFIGSKQGFYTENQRFQSFPQTGNVAYYRCVLDALRMTAQIMQKLCNILQIM